MSLDFLLQDFRGLCDENIAVLGFLCLTHYPSQQTRENIQRLNKILNKKKTGPLFLDLK